MFPKGPCSGRSHRTPNTTRRASRTPRGPPRNFIPGTNAIESLNYQLRKIIKNRGHFPNDDAAVKLLWLAIRDIEDKRAKARAREAGRPPNQRTAPGFLIEGNTSQGWNAALGALSIAFADRLEPYL